MVSRRVKVLAAEAKKAGNASEDACLKPRPPSLIGRDAWTHCMSVSCELVRFATAERSKLSAKAA